MICQVAEPSARDLAGFTGAGLVDSGPLVALFNAADRWHAPVLAWLHGAVAGSLTEVLRISERFADLPLDLADASIAEAAARLKLRHVLWIDADFDIYRDRAGKPLTNLLRA